MTRALGMLLALSVSSGCGDRGAQLRLDGLRIEYNQLLEGDFPASLHGADAARVLRALDHFSGPPEVIEQARDLAEQIRSDRARNPKVEVAENGLNLVATGPIQRTTPRDAREAVWLSAIKIGASRIEFERYWFPCFRPLDEAEAVWTRTGTSACSKRLGYASIQEVHFDGDTIRRVVARELPVAPSD
jgi:hypothetical protein